MQQILGRRFYYGWVVVAITFLTLLVTSGVRAAPSVLINPLEDEFGWSRAAISFAVSLGILLYGLAGPLGGSLMDRFGARAMMFGGLALVVASTGLSAGITAIWQLQLLWGVLSGVGTGVAAAVLSATVATRWFVARRGLVIGILGGAISGGQLVFLPLLMWLVVATGWRGAVLVLAGTVAVVLLPVLLLMRDDPADIGLQPYGAAPTTGANPRGERAEPATRVMWRAMHVPELWLLSGSYFVCGATSIGLVGTHLIPHSIDRGIPEVTAASVLGLMGAMNFVGTIASGWLTDRYDPRRLLAAYYVVRGLSLLLLPFVGSFAGLAVFAVFFGLDYIATVPPTVALTADIFGRRNVGTVYGWVFFAHQFGAALTAWLAGVTRDSTGSYQAAFLAGGALAIIGGLMATRIDRRPSPLLLPEVAGSTA